MPWTAWIHDQDTPITGTLDDIAHALGYSTRTMYNWRRADRPGNRRLIPSSENPQVPEQVVRPKPQRYRGVTTAPSVWIFDQGYTYTDLSTLTGLSIGRIKAIISTHGPNHLINYLAKDPWFHLTGSGLRSSTDDIHTHQAIFSLNTTMEPTSIRSFHTSIIWAIGQVVGPDPAMDDNVRILLRFRATSTVFREQTRVEFREIPWPYMDSMDGFLDMLNVIQETGRVQLDSVYDTDLEGADNIHIIMDSFTILWDTPMAGGCYLGSHGMATIIGDTHTFKVSRIKSTNNNCLLDAIRRGHPSILPHDNREIREALSIPHGQPMTMEHVEAISTKYKINIIIYRKDGSNVQCLQPNVTKSINILYDENHYSHIVQMTKTKKKRTHRRSAPAKPKVDVFFDIETVYNPKEEFKLIPYSISYLVAKGPNDVDMANVVNHTGPTCTVEFLCRMMDLATTHDVALIGYNNSGFDNYVLLDAIKTLSINISGTIFAGTRILRMYLGSMVVQDLYRITMGSLAKCCDDYHIHHMKEEGYSHADVQAAYEAGALDQWVEDNMAVVVSYNNHDVLALGELYYKVRGAIHDMVGMDIRGQITISSMAYKYWRTTLTKDMVVEGHDYETHQWLRRAIVAGRSQCMKGPYHGVGDYDMLDVNSLYPHVMATNPFPVGHGEMVQEYREDGYGVWNCTIVGQNGPHPVVIPRRPSLGSLDWTYRGEMDVVLTTVDVEMVRKYHGREAVIVRDGMWWRDGAHIFQEYIGRLYRVKGEQDELRANGHPYNPSLRNMAKLLLNSISGKMVQRNFPKHRALISSDAQYRAFLDKSVAGSVEVAMVHDGTYLVIGDTLPRYNKYPIHVGVYIYSYARRLMYDHVYSKVDVLYTDTDSALVTREDSDRLRRESPWLFQGGMGSLESDYDEIKEVILVGSKAYAMDCGKDGWRYKLRGVREGCGWVTYEEVLDRWGSVDSIPWEDVRAMYESEDDSLCNRYPDPEIFMMMMDGYGIVVFDWMMDRTCRVVDGTLDMSIRMRWLAKHI